MRDYPNLFVHLLNLVSLAAHIVEQTEVLVLVGNESSDQFVDVADSGGGLDLMERFFVALHLFDGNLHVGLVLGHIPGTAEQKEEIRKKKVREKQVREERREKKVRG